MINTTKYFIDDNKLWFNVIENGKYNISIINRFGNTMYSTVMECLCNVNYFVSHDIIKDEEFIFKVNNKQNYIKRYNNTIKQVSVGNSVGFFKKNLMSRWNLHEYYDSKTPSLFFGVWGNIDKIENHKGFKLIFPVDSKCSVNLNKINNLDNLIVVDRPHIQIPDKFKKVKGEFEIKNYEMFKPSILGDKIHAYVGQKERRQQFNYNLIKEIQEKIDYKIIISEKLDNKNYDNIFLTKNSVYDKCFLNLNFSKDGGLTTVIEMGLMGIKTITNNKNRWENMIPYHDSEDIVNIINNESKKIGTLQKGIDIHSINEVWMNLKYWNNFL